MLGAARARVAGVHVVIVEHHYGDHSFAYIDSMVKKDAMHQEDNTDK
jgi:S-formylglutathione hydrolase FrmB